jgi:hypothetical protein
LSRTIPFEHRRKRFEVRVSADGALELWLEGCLRKRRDSGGGSPQYVWTNIELEWEEHHYVEARYWSAENRLQVTINRVPVFDRTLT